MASSAESTPSPSLLRDARSRLDRLFDARLEFAGEARGPMLQTARDVLDIARQADDDRLERDSRLAICQFLSNFMLADEIVRESVLEELKSHRAALASLKAPESRQHLVSAWAHLVAGDGPQAFGEAMEAFELAWRSADHYVLAEAIFASQNALGLSNPARPEMLAGIASRMTRLRGIRPPHPSLPFLESHWLGTQLATGTCDELRIREFRDVAVGLVHDDPAVRPTLWTLVNELTKAAVHRSAPLVRYLADVLEELAEPDDHVAVIAALGYAVQAAGGRGDARALKDISAHRDRRLKALTAEVGAESIAHLAIHTWATNAFAWLQYSALLRSRKARASELKEVLSYAAAEATRADRHLRSYRSLLGTRTGEPEAFVRAAHEQTQNEMLKVWDGAVRAEVAMHEAEKLALVDRRGAASAVTGARPDEHTAVTDPAGTGTLRRPGKQSFQTARESEAAFLLLVARLSWRAIPTPLEVDHGIDYRLEIMPTKGSAEHQYEVLVQLKGTRRKLGSRGLTIRIAAATAAYWQTKLLPVLVCLHHIPSDRFFYRWYDEQRPVSGKTLGIHFAETDEFDPKAIEGAASRYYDAFREVLASPAGRLVYGHVLAGILTCVRYTWSMLPLWIARERARQRGDSYDSPSPESELWGVMLIIMTVADLELTPRPFTKASPEGEQFRQLIDELVALRDAWYMNPIPTVEGWTFGLYDTATFPALAPNMVAKLLEIAEFISLNALRIPASEVEQRLLEE